MIYAEYARLKIKCSESLKVYESIIDEQQRLFEKTQPQGISVETERVSGGESLNAFDSYLIAKERAKIDERLTEAKGICDNLIELLKLKEQELRASKDWYDIIYKLRYIDNLSITKIENRLPYSRAQIWRILNKIKINL